MPTPPPGPEPAVTVVVPVRNEAGHVGLVLDDLRAQELPGACFEILVVDGRSEDGTRAHVERLAALDPRVRLIDNPWRLSSGARRLGVEAARGRFVLFVDGHCRIPGRRLLADMLELFARTGADCLARPQPLVPTAPGRVARAVAAARSSPFGHSGASTIYEERERAVSPVSAGAMYRREVFERIGTFDVAFDACEDVELNWRAAAAGLSCWTSPRLAVRYEPRRRLSALLRQMVRYGRGRARLHRKHPAALSPESLVPAAFVAGLPLLAATPWLPGGWALAVAAPYALYALLALLASLPAARRAGADLLPLLPLTFLTIHVGLGAGYLWGRVERWPPPPREPGP